MSADAVQTAPAPPCAPEGEQSMAERMRDAVITVRPDLEVTRHTFRGEPSYVVRDPVNFSTQQFTVEDYRLLVAIDAESTLGGTFDALVEAGDLDREDEEDYYGFVVGLHRAGLLALPIGDHKALFTRYTKRMAAKRMSRLMSPIFMRIPLWNPDSFLNRTIGATRWLFTPVGLVAWAVLLLAAGVVAFTRRADLAAPLLTILELESLPLLWVILIGLKFFHEFGHAYACKAFGGHVPEMGAFMIMGTPCAYVDATAAWGFTSLGKRMWVNLGGMYFESFFAAAGVLVWAATPPGLLNTAAYQVAIMASVVTIGFNINPLAKFDGYYVLSDAVGIPNLRERAAAELKAILARYSVGLQTPPSPFGLVTRTGLIVFAIGSAFYRVTIMLGLSAILASKLFIVGFALAGVYVAVTLFGVMARLARFLWWSPETAHVRRRAVGVSAVGIIVAVSLLAAVPFKQHTRLVGTIGTMHEAQIFAPETARLEQVLVDPGQRLQAGEPLARFHHDDLALAAAEKHVALQLAQLETEIALATDRPQAYRLAPRLESAEAASAAAQDRVAELTPRAPFDGTVIELAPDLRAGSVLQAGEPFARVGTGAAVVRLLANERSLVGAQIAEGGRIECRAAIDPGTIHSGTVVSIAPVGSRTIDDEAVTQLAGGPITIDPASGRAAQSYYEIIIELDRADTDLRHGTVMTARLQTEPQTVASSMLDRLRRFAAALETN